ncbi:MAG: ABC transporter permease [Brevibacterium yomogidense]
MSTLTSPTTSTTSVRGARGGAHDSGTHDTGTARSGTRPLTGTLGLVRLILRVDRIRALVWVLAVGAMGFYFAHAIQVIAEDEETLATLGGLYSDPVGRMMVGPGFGMEDPTHARFFAAGYALFVYILIALMSVFTVVRHTRADEQAGRAELVRANVVGRHATLTATLLVTSGLVLAASALVLAGGLSAGYAWEGSLLVATTAAAVGLFFTGASATAAQLGESSRGASALGGGLLGLAYVIRMAGDAPEVGGTALSWASPLGWAQQTAPYVDDLWWPLLPLMGGAAVLAGLAFWLSTRRDVGAGLLPARLGRAEARPSLGTPLGLALRTLRGTLRGWAIALLLTSLMFGSYAQTMLDAAGSLPPELADVFVGEDIMLGYLAYIALFMAVFVTAAGVGSLQQVRSEESSGRAEYALSAPMSRTAWLGAHLAVTIGGALLILIAVGAALGAGAAASLEEDGASRFGELLAAGVLKAPAVLCILGIVTALLGWLPRLAAPVGWLLVGFSGVIGTFGSLLDLPDFVFDLDPFGHLAEYPVEEVAWEPVAWLTAIGAAGIAAGLVGWRRREVGRI